MTQGRRCRRPGRFQPAQFARPAHPTGMHNPLLPRQRALFRGNPRLKVRREDALVQDSALCAVQQAAGQSPFLGGGGARSTTSSSAAGLRAGVPAPPADSRRGTSGVRGAPLRKTSGKDGAVPHGTSKAKPAQELRAGEMLK